ncbi:Bipolar DNA helicase HerA [Janthinobacterium sp. CG23_2]|nr:Bipolar DNA helicase HerA [Janthinobacterium sp. CG23_2]CUU31460.1 Bipolar DNA helicase HerA [Janthinobacterium sp. CG23_2]
MTICVGEVIAVEGTKVSIRIFEESNRDTLYYNGERYKGVSIREYLSIQRGFRDIICLVQGEYLDERRFHEDPTQKFFDRRVDVKPIGYLEQGEFKEGIKYLPMIKDQTFLIKEEVVTAIYTRKSGGLRIGKLLKEEISIELPWQSLFNTHIGIFGNTGSGKSNTLTMLYTALFGKKADQLRNKSHFAILDFNGEYTTDQFLPANRKNIFRLSTGNVAGDTFPLPPSEFWSADILSILFQATANTQRPFLNRIVNGRNKFQANNNSLNNYLRKIFEETFSDNAKKPESLDLLRRVAALLGAQNLENTLKQTKWVGGQANTFVINQTYFNGDGLGYAQILSVDVNNIDCSHLDAFDELILRSHLQLTQDLNSGFVQFEHIQPLLKRAEAALVHLRKVLTIGEAQPDDKILTVISLRNCNQEVKKILPLLIAKHYYSTHRNTVSSPPDRTMHLIIDEAHNILSDQSTREHEAWRDYRLELFEEIIKEGRKFGMFLTLSSQRPADISPTIVSQLHNFFLHRLVNERDLFLIDNTISTLDSMSKAMIPNLPKGCCIVTGTSFDLPMTLQVDRLEQSKQPDSEDVDLFKLWI